MNPYDPNNPVAPAYFGGRKTLLRGADEAIERVIQGRHTGMLIYGHRGIGKTSAVKAIEARTGDRMPIVHVALNAPTDKQSLVERLIAEIGAAIREASGFLSRLSDKGRALLARVEGGEFLGIGVSLKERRSTPDVALKESLLRVKDAAKLCIALDDADWMEKEALALLKTKTEELSSPSLLIIVSGGPELREQLVSEYSPVIRFFSGFTYDLSEFTLEETREALELPAKGTGAEWSREAVDRVQSLTSGYPYLVQCVARAAFRLGRIDEADIHKATNNAMDIAGTWLGGELTEASDKDVIAFAKLSSLGKKDIVAKEAAQAGVQGVYLKRLVKLGVLKNPHRAHYTLAKAPLVALYQVQVRGLRPDK